MRAFKGAGAISLALYSSGASFALRNFIEVGNASDYNRSFSQQDNTIPNFLTAAGGTWASQSRLDQIDGGFTLYDWSPINLARVLWGNTNTLAATAITGEAHVIKAGGFIPTNRIINTSVAPVVKKGAAVIAPTDYTVTTGGLLIKSSIGTATVLDGDTITIDYTPQAGFDVQALVNAAPLVSVFFNGVNAYNGKPLTDKVWKARLGVAQNFNLIGTELTSLPLTMKIELDDTIVAEGMSQYFEHQGVL